jgi:enamine deaminase RidA (YjgF/YER057c/UK114 family)
MGPQARQTMDNIGATLRSCGLDFPNVVKCVVTLADMSEWAEFNKVYVTYFAPGRLPVRSAPGAAVEVECIARYPEDSSRLVPI